MTHNIKYYRATRFLRNLLFWQAIWFLYFQQALSPAEAILLYAIYDLATTFLEVPSGYVSDRIGRKNTLIASAVMMVVASTLFLFGNSFTAFALGNIALGASMAFASGTDEAFLYETLEALGRKADIEREELIAWRFSFAALAFSAVTGGAMAVAHIKLPYAGVLAASLALLWVTLKFTDPKASNISVEHLNPSRITQLKQAFTNPTLLWLMALSSLMYGFSHLPFVFGQPFILQALATIDLSAGAPLVSGGLTTLMMLVSLLASGYALRLRQKFGLTPLLLLAFGLQILIIAVLALSGSIFAITILLLRMVPDAFSRPFIIAQIQPRLARESRATYLSITSLIGRILFAAALTASAINVHSVDAMSLGDISTILTAATLIGIVFWAILAIASRSIPIDAAQNKAR